MNFDQKDVTIEKFQVFKCQSLAKYFAEKQTKFKKNLNFQSFNYAKINV